MARPPRNPFRAPLPLAPGRAALPWTPAERAGAIASAAGSAADPAPLLDVVVNWGLYVAGGRQPDVPLEVACRRAAGGEGFLWLGVHEPSLDQLDQLGETFGLHPLAVEDAANPHQRPKLERYDDVLFLSMRTLAYVEGGDRSEGGDVVETGSVMVFVGEHYVLTVRHGRHAAMSGLRQRLEASPQQLAFGPSAVLHAIADKVVDDYLAVTDAVTEDIEEIESDVFASRAPSDIERIYQLKRDVIEMKRTVTALATPLHELADRPQRLVHPDIREYFRDVEDHLTRASEQVSNFDELLTTIVQANLAQVTVAQNEDMRKISAWVAILAVPTAVAGVYGMNFGNMPELSLRFGYPVVLAVMALSCTALYRGFKRNGWL
jgi:magnesium transporter